MKISLDYIGNTLLLDFYARHFHRPTSYRRSPPTNNLASHFWVSEYRRGDTGAGFPAQ
jgi:hypothetical protein